jgi:hypothetical protein
MSNNNLTDQQLQQKIAELPDEITPERDLWLGIEKAINSPLLPKTKSPWNISQRYQTPMAWAASIVLAVLLTWQILTPASQPAAMSLAQTMQQTFQQQKQGLLVSFGQPKLTALPQAMQQQLNELAAAQQTINQALKSDPTNADLLNLLRFTQQQELKLLTQLFQPKWQTI